MGRELPWGHRIPVEVATGEVRAASSGILRASALGSCVAVALFHAESGAAGLAHVMLPGRAPDGGGSPPNRYAVNVIQVLTEAMEELGAAIPDSVAVVAGGANVLGEDGETIGFQVVASVSELLSRNRIRILASRVGGTDRRSLTFDIDERRIFYSRGDSGIRLLLEFDA